MKPVHVRFGHVTFDLTECKVHLIEGELVAFYPKAWEVMGEIDTITAVGGNPVKLKQYRITEWDRASLGSIT